MRRLRLPSPLAITAIALAVFSSAASACPWASVDDRSLSQEIAAADVAALATMTVPPDVDDDAKFDKATFRIDRVLKGKPHLPADKDGNPSPIQTTYEGGSKKGTRFLLTGSGSPEIKWAYPWTLSERGVDYVLKLEALPPKGPDRLKHFMPYLEDREARLSHDAFLELSAGSYKDLKALKPLMDREKLWKGISNKEVSIPPRQRLYFVMLGICGTADDVPKLAEKLKTKPREGEQRDSVGAMEAYLMLERSDKGVSFVEEQFIVNRDASYSDLYTAIMLLRFLADEEPVIVSKKRATAAFHKVLDRPDYADLVIPDLARWEDWSVMDRLVAMFKTAEKDRPSTVETDSARYVRVPIAQYLIACPLPQAKTYLNELRKLDPKSVEWAEKNPLRSRDR
jgi:hypothetical protein